NILPLSSSTSHPFSGAHLDASRGFHRLLFAPFELIVCAGLALQHRPTDGPIENSPIRCDTHWFGTGALHSLPRVLQVTTLLSDGTTKSNCAVQSVSKLRTGDCYSSTKARASTSNSRSFAI